MRFRLHKWYLDVVAADGEAAIVYAARLRWGPLRVGYGALIHAPPAGPAQSRQTWRFRPPVPRDGLAWAEPRLGAAGGWTVPGPAMETALMAGLRWRIHQPGGEAWLRLPGGRELRGRGYAEELRLEVPPWRLPFRGLRWGRFVPDAGGPALAWIQWSDGLSRGWCFLDGAPTALDTAGDDAVCFPGGRLALAHHRVLREGPLLRELLGPCAGLAPGRLRSACEWKALARGTLEAEGGVHEGWVVHERVRL